MSLRRTLASLVATLAVTTGASVLAGTVTAAPAAAADPNRDAFECWPALDPAGAPVVNPASMTVLAEQTVALTGLEGSLTQTTYALPGDQRCDIVRLQVPAAAQGRHVTVNSSYDLTAKYVTASKNEVVSRGGGANTNVPVAKADAATGGRTEYAGEAVVVSHVYPVTQTGTDASTGEPYTSTALGVKWSVAVTMHESSSTHYVNVSKKAVKAAAAAREVAVSDSAAIVKHAKKTAKRILRDAVDHANGRKERKAAKRLYAQKMRAAKKNAGQMIAAAQDTYAKATAPIAVVTPIAGATGQAAGELVIPVPNPTPEPTPDPGTDPGTGGDPADPTPTDPTPPADPPAGDPIGTAVAQ